MSISGSLSNALSGLTASSRAAELVSSNVANAMTEGYGRRELALSSRSADGASAGVTIDAVRRVVDQAVLRDRRLAEADVAGARVETGFLEDLQTLIGTPDEPSSLSARLAYLEGALIEAASRPDLSARLQAVTQTAGSLADGLNAASDGIQRLRKDADAEISKTVEMVNATLQEVAEVNALILRSGGTGRDVSALLDQGQVLVDRIAGVVPLRVLPRENETVALYTMGGARLIDGFPATLGFLGTGTIAADMTQASGSLSGLSINGEPVRTDGDYAPFRGSRLAALFDIRDRLAPQAQERVDSLARDLIERTGGADATLPPGEPGLFTDAGGPFDPLEYVGLAGRLSVNAAVLPSQGGNLWRLRDGIGAAAAGPVGNNAALVALSDALMAERVPGSGDITTAARSAGGLIGDLVSLIGSELRNADLSASFTTARFDALREVELGEGVDTDAEMQKLLLIEQSYAANAQVIRTADELIQILLGL